MSAINFDDVQAGFIGRLKVPTYNQFCGIFGCGQEAAAVIEFYPQAGAGKKLPARPLNVCSEDMKKLEGKSG